MDETPHREPALITPLELARDYLQCSRSKAYELIARGEVPGVIRVGTSVRISRAAIEDWIHEQTISSLTRRT
jgi:excisionase family DNA binding protein